MSTRLRVLNVEDSVTDSELLLRPFQAAGYELVWVRVETAQELRDALENSEWDVVLADYSMPQFDAVAALKIFQEYSLDIPFIVVSGAIGEDLGVAMMRAGAHDYVLKHHLVRLIPAVDRELRETQIRRERRIAQERLRENEHRFRQLAEVSPHMVWQTDTAGRIEYANHLWREYFGNDAVSNSFQEWCEVIHPEDAARIHWQRENADTMHGSSVEARLRHQDGAYRWFVCRDAAVRDAEGRIQHWVHTAADIHALKENDEALRLANAKLQQFAYAAAHDLLEPLRNISTSLRLLERLYAKHPQKEAGELIEDAIADSQRLHGMLRGLYELTKIDAEQSAGAFTDAGETMRQVIANLRTAIAESDAVVTASALPRVAVREAHLLQLFQNLIGNSLKFRDKARRLQVAVTAERQPHDWLFTVTDNGLGFESSQAERIFELFHRVNRDDATGVGIGLALCSRVVNSYGGRIWAEGRPGEGATFHFTLPAVEVSGKPEEEWTAVARS